jgi:hypothetical protein
MSGAAYDQTAGDEADDDVEEEPCLNLGKLVTGFLNALPNLCLGLR